MSKPFLLCDSSFSSAFFDVDGLDVVELFGELAKVKVFNSGEIPKNLLTQADALIVSSQTKLTADTDLSTIKFLATPTAGINHIAPTLLTNNSHIKFYHAPGCNAQAVVDYVLASIDLYAKDKLSQKTLGIIGFGAVGKLLAKWLQPLVKNIIAFDPLAPNWQQDNSYKNVQPCELHELLATADIITIHASLHDERPFPSNDMLKEEQLNLIKPNSLLINAARGEIINEPALFAYIKHKPDNFVVLDVWANEPNINLDLLQIAPVATQHIAGYSQAAKIHALAKIYQDFCNHFSLQYANKLENINRNAKTYDSSNTTNILAKAAEIVALKATTKSFKQAMFNKVDVADSSTFISQRTNYKLRIQLSGLEG